MSDIAGPPAPKPVTAVVRGADRTAKSSRDPNETPRQATDDSGNDKSKSEQREGVHAREPAVSISASAAHLRIGEELQERVRDIDVEGRPIIVTETATFALRPDAGLKPGDDVILHVVETGKTVAAELLRHNDHIINPPIRLSLVVIAIHSIQSPGSVQQTTSPETLDHSYRPTARPNAVTSSVSTTAAQPADAEMLAKVLSRSNNSLSLKPDVTGSEIKPDPLIKSNSTDMATLIAIQAKTPQGAPQTIVDTAASPNLQTSSGTSTHIIPPSVLTEPAGLAHQTQPQGQAQTAPITPSAPGVGPPVAAITLTGNPVQIQLLDLRISQVSPAEVAEVVSVQPLVAGVARTLPISAQTLGNDALSRLETTKGTFIVPQTAATSLVSEFIRVSQPENPAQIQVPQQTQIQQQAQATPTPEAPTYNARLTSPGTQTGRPVQVQFTAPAQQSAIAANVSQSHIISTVDGVHTVRAFLTGEGPKSDFRIDTSFGTLTVTMANHVRPAVGDTVAILPNSSNVTANTVTVPIGAEVAATTVPGANGWPNLEQAYALVQSGMPSAANAMDTRSAQGGPKLLNSMMFLMAALKGGSPGGWLGKVTEQAIEARSGSLLKLLKGDLARLFNAGSETTSSEWRSLLLPFDTRAPDMPMLSALFSQPQNIDPDDEQTDDNASSDEDRDQRFIIEVQFSVLGAIQLDGIVRSNKFDLTLWSYQALPQLLTTEVHDIFMSALAANGFSGAIRFKESDTFPVDVAAVLKKQLTS